MSFSNLFGVHLSLMQLKWLFQIFEGFEFAATALEPNTLLPKTLLPLDVLVTNWKHRIDRGFPVEEKFPSLPLCQRSRSSLPLVQQNTLVLLFTVVYITVSDFKNVYLQMIPPVASSQVPFPRALCPQTLHPATLPPVGISVSALVAGGHQLSSPPQERNLASHYRPFGSTWVIVMFIQCITWCR